MDHVESPYTVYLSKIQRQKHRIFNVKQQAAGQSSFILAKPLVSHGFAARQFHRFRPLFKKLDSFEGTSTAFSIINHGHYFQIDPTILYIYIYTVYIYYIIIIIYIYI